MIQTDFKCQLREVSEVISWETVTVCSITSSLSHHCNPRIRCNDTLFLHISMKCTGFHPCDHIHMYRSDTIMDDLAGSLSAHTHHLRTLGQLLFYNSILLLTVASEWKHHSLYDSSLCTPQGTETNCLTNLNQNAEKLNRHAANTKIMQLNHLATGLFFSY